MMKLTAVTLARDVHNQPIIMIGIALQETVDYMPELQTETGVLFPFQATFSPVHAALIRMDNRVKAEER